MLAALAGLLTNKTPPHQQYQPSPVIDWAAGAGQLPLWPITGHVQIGGVQIHSYTSSKFENFLHSMARTEAGGCYFEVVKFQSLAKFLNSARFNQSSD